jgi:hypothetical protein
MKLTLLGMSLFVASLLGGCATQFTGSAYYPGGARACFNACLRDQMQMSGFAYLGEYSSACVCEPQRAAGATAATDAAGGPSATMVAASTGGAVGVVLQARAAQAAQNVH